MKVGFGVKIKGMILHSNGDAQSRGCIFYASYIEEMSFALKDIDIPTVIYANLKHLKFCDRQVGSFLFSGRTTLAKFCSMK